MTNETKRRSYDLVILNKTSKEKFKLFLLSLGNKTQNTFNHFGKINSNTVTSIAIREITRSDKEKFFGFVGEELVVYGFLTRFDKITKKHNCTLGIAVSDTWQKKGFGKKMCQHMIDFAWEHGLTKIWLAVYSDNKIGINLYKSLGFQIEGIFINDEKFDTINRHVISMARFKNGNDYDKKRLGMWKKLNSDL